MTELETMRRAKMYIDMLAQGMDPITNQEIPNDSVLNHVRLARCFFYVSDVLGQVISNGGVIGSKPKRMPFAADHYQLANVQLSQEPVRISQLTEIIHKAVGNPQMRKPSTTLITNWLMEKGFLEKQVLADGTTKRVPTYNGMMIGLSVQTRQGQHGEYQAVYYNMEAQKFVLDNLPAMLIEEK